MSRHRFEGFLLPPLRSLPLLEYRPTIEDATFSNKSYTHRLDVKPKRKLKIYFDGFIYYRFPIIFSDEPVMFEDKFRYQGQKSEVRSKIEEHAKSHNYANLVQEYPVNWTEAEYTYVPFGNLPPADYKKIRMRAEHYFNININIFANTIELKTSKDNCVPETLESLYGKSLRRKNSPFESLKNANTEEIMAFCKKYGIRAIAYNIHKRVIAEHIPIHDTQKYKTLVYLSYMNHMYLIKNKFLIEKPSNKFKTYVRMESNDLQEYFKQILNTKIIPSNIKVYQQTITSFINDEILYFANDDYEDVKTIASKFMFSDKIPHQSSITSIIKYLEPLYTSNLVNSFLPIQHTKPAFFYNTIPDKSRPTETIDKNKAYSHILRDLPFLLSTDFRTHECLKTNKFLGEDALYIASPNTPNILMPRQDIYSGSHIKFCLSKFNFTIHEVLKCKQHDNHFKPLINDLFQAVDESVAKKVIVRAIGLFQSECSTQITEQATIISTEEHDPTYETIPINDESEIQLIPSKTIKNIYNRKPIAIQIKDKMNQMLFEKMIDLSLTDQDIIQINTDSITFYSKPVDLKLSKKFEDWKRGEYKQKQGSIYEVHTTPITFFQTIENNNTIITGPAGNGKSYYIQHMDLTDAIILSSKHSAIRQHREKNLNAHVIQKFSGVAENQQTTFPSESHIIVEECGILTKQHWDFLFKCILLNKRLTILGDFNQLLPYDEQHMFNRPQWINMVFNNQQEMNTNWRNTFTLDYYKQLQSGSKEFLTNEILKHSTKTPEEADVIISYTNATTEKYNNYMLAYHNKTINDSDVPIMCITNDLRDKDIYNNFIFKSQDIDRKLYKHFRIAYARTLYNMQGDECLSYYMCPEDIKWFANPRMAYTLISRIKNKCNP